MFAYPTNGAEIVEFDYTTGIERRLDGFPVPADLWTRQRAAEGLDDPVAAERLLTPNFPDRAKPLRYYQEIAVNRAVQAALQGRKRILLTLCIGAGKTAVAFQISWKLWSARWNGKGVNRTPKILFLADRNVLVDDPMAKDCHAARNLQRKGSRRLIPRVAKSVSVLAPSSRRRSAFRPRLRIETVHNASASHLARRAPCLCQAARARPSGNRRFPRQQENTASQGGTPIFRTG